MTFPSARDCEHGHQRGKCPECEAAEDIADLTASLEAAESEMRAWRDEARRLRTRVERLRGALKSAAGRAYEVAEFSLGDDCMNWAGDMEPPLMGSNDRVERPGAASGDRSARTTGCAANGDAEKGE